MEADYGMTQQAFNDAKGDDGLYIQFNTKAVPDKEATEENGRPCFMEKPYIQIMIPGDKDNVIHRPVKSSDKLRWPRQWAAFEQSLEQPLEGTPLIEWPGVTRSQCEELAHFGCKTVEQLASMPDTSAQKFMGSQLLRQRARDYVEQAKGDAPMEKLRNENEALRNEIEGLKDQFAEMSKSKKAG